MDIIIKTATTEDLKNVQELNLKLFKKEHKEYDHLLNLDWTFGEAGINYYKKRISGDDGCVFIAIINNKIIGYICGSLIKSKSYRNLPISAELENTFVLDKFRSKGVGKKLYNRFVDWCKEKNVSKIKVEASVKNELAIKFYRNNNFKDHTLILEADL